MNFRSTLGALALLSPLAILASAPAQAGCYYAGCHSHVSYNEYLPTPYLNVAPHVEYYAPRHRVSHRMMKRVKTTRTIYQPVTRAVPVQTWRYVTTYQPVSRTVVRHGWGHSEHMSAVYPPAAYPPAVYPPAYAPAYAQPLYPAQMIYGY